MLVRLRALGDPGQEACDVGAIRLLAGERVEDEVVVGGPQDSDSSHAAALVLDEGEAWSPPRGARGESFRTLTIGAGGNAVGVARFQTEGLLLDSRHSFELVYRGGKTESIDVEIVKDGQVVTSQRLSAGNGGWEQARIRLPEERAASALVAQTGAMAASRVRRWPGEGSLMIDAVELLDESGEERAVFDVGTSLTLRIVFSARQSGSFDVTPTAVLYRLDAILVARFIGERVTLDLREGEQHEALLRVPSLNLGDDDYVFAVALYKTLDIDDVEPSEYYDLLDRNYHFKVVGTPPLLRGIFRHPGSWTVG